MWENPATVFRNLAETGLQKSLENIDNIDEMNETHFISCPACQASQPCQDMELRRAYREAANSVAVDYLMVRDWLNDGKD